MPTVKIPPVLRARTGGEAEVAASGATVGEVLAALAEQPSRHPRAALRRRRRAQPLRQRLPQRRGRAGARRARDPGRGRRHGRDPAGDGRRALSRRPARAATAGGAATRTRRCAASARSAAGSAGASGDPPRAAASRFSCSAATSRGSSPRRSRSAAAAGPGRLRITTQPCSHGRKPGSTLTTRTRAPSARGSTTRSEKRSGRRRSTAGRRAARTFPIRSPGHASRAIASHIPGPRIDAISSPPSASTRWSSASQAAQAVGQVGEHRGGPERDRRSRRPGAGGPARDEERAKRRRQTGARARRCSGGRCRSPRARRAPPRRRTGRGPARRHSRSRGRADRPTSQPGGSPPSIRSADHRADRSQCLQGSTGSSSPTRRASRSGGRGRVRAARTRR